MNIESMQFQQKQELFESIRHFSKYMAYGTLDYSMVTPEIAEKVQDDMMALYEEHYKDE